MLELSQGAKKRTNNMDVTQIPFNKFLGISKCSAPDEGLLMLRDAECYANHLNTVHASAQFALGEAASGGYLLQRFKTIVEKGPLISVVRNAEVKFKKAGKGAIRASANIPDDVAGRTVASLEKKGKVLIPVDVVISDSGGNITMTATYEWFVQKAEIPA